MGMCTQRELTTDEQRFVEAARAGWFGIAYDDATGTPFALGAEHAENLFPDDLDVESFRDPGDSATFIYQLRGAA